MEEEGFRKGQGTSVGGEGGGGGYTSHLHNHIQFEATGPSQHTPPVCLFRPSAPVFPSALSLCYSYLVCSFFFLSFSHHFPSSSSIPHLLSSLPCPLPHSYRPSFSFSLFHAFLLFVPLPPHNYRFPHDRYPTLILRKL